MLWSPGQSAPSLRTHVLDPIADFIACLQSLRWPAIGSFLQDMSVGPDVDINLVRRGGQATDPHAAPSRRPHTHTTHTQGPFTSGTEYYSAETRESLLGVKVKPE